MTHGWIDDHGSGWCRCQSARREHCSIQMPRFCAFCCSTQPVEGRGPENVATVFVEVRTMDNSGAPGVCTHGNRPKTAGERIRPAGQAGGAASGLANGAAHGIHPAGARAAAAVQREQSMA